MRVYDESTNDGPIDKSTTAVMSNNSAHKKPKKGRPRKLPFDVSHQLLNSINDNALLRRTSRVTKFNESFKLDDSPEKIKQKVNKLKKGNLKKLKKRLADHHTITDVEDSMRDRDSQMRGPLNNKKIVIKPKKKASLFTSVDSLPQIPTSTAQQQHLTTLPSTPTISFNTADRSNVSLDAASLMEMIRTAVKEIVSETPQNMNKTNANCSIVSGNTLSRQQLMDIRKSIFDIYEKQMKIQNTITIYQSHKDNNTVPNTLNFMKFPKPLWADDAIFVDEHNNIIRNTQSQMIDSIIDRGKVIIDCLNVELSEIRVKLDKCYSGNKDSFIENIKITVKNNLKEYFEASNSKHLRINYFEDHNITEHGTQDITDDYIIN